MVAQYYALAAKIVLLIISIIHIFLKGKRKETCLIYLNKIYKHSKYGIIVILGLNIYTWSTGGITTLDYLNMALILAMIPCIIILSIQMLKDWSLYIIYGEDEMQSNTFSYYKDLKNTYYSPYFYSLLFVRRIILVVCTITISVCAFYLIGGKKVACYI